MNKKSVSIADTLPFEGPAADLTRWARQLILGRQNFTPRRLLEPGPSADQLDSLLEAAAAAPDHGELTPWRFILIPQQRRQRLGEIFRDALLERDNNATAQQQLDAQEKAMRGPCLLLAIVDLGPRDKAIPDIERMISLGCAIQNMLLLARSMAFESGLSSGQALVSSSFRKAFGLASHEQAACFVSFGTAAKPKALRSRPAAARISSEFSG